MCFNKPSLNWNWRDQHAISSYREEQLWIFLKITPVVSYGEKLSHMKQHTIHRFLPQYSGTNTNLTYNDFFLGSCIDHRVLNLIIRITGWKTDSKIPSKSVWRHPCIFMVKFCTVATVVFSQYSCSSVIHWNPLESYIYYKHSLNKWERSFGMCLHRTLCPRKKHSIWPY